MNAQKQSYIGVKVVDGTPMNRQEYNDYRGWTLPSDEDGADEGYLVEYHNGSPGNHPDHKGYISWSPKEQFDNSNTKCVEVTSESMAAIMKYFEYSHLPPSLQAVSATICELAKQMDVQIPNGPEKSAGLRKLLEAKDCFVRGSI